MQRSPGMEPPLLLETTKAELAQDAQEKVRLFHQLKSKYTGLKYNMLHSLTYFYLLESLEQGTVDQADAETAGRELKEVVRSVKGLKSQLRDLRDQVEEHGDAADTDFAKYTELKQALESGMADLKTKEDEMKDMEEDADSEEDEEIGESVPELEQRLAAARARLAGLAERRPQEEEALRRTEEQLADVQAEVAALGRDQPKELAKYEELQKLLEHLSGVSVLSADADRLVLQVAGGEREGQEGAPQLRATVIWRNTALLGRLIDDVQVSVMSLEVEDIVDAVKGTPHLAYLVSSLSSRWQQHLPLNSEVEQLRDRFALDWVSSERTVTVLYGRDASMMVSLQVEEGYPAAGQVRLLRATGLPDHVSSDQLQPPIARPSLRQWLEHMHDALVGQAQP